MTGPPARQLLTNNLLTMLRLPRTSNGTGFRIGDNRAPRFSDGSGGFRVQPISLDYPYGVLYDIDGGDRTGDYAEPFLDATFAYQLSMVALRRDQAQLAADMACTVLVGRANGAYTSTLADPSGLSVIRRTLDPPAGVIQQGTAQELVWHVPIRFRIDVTAA